jgi:hypothetical protein
VSSVDNEKFQELMLKQLTSLTEGQVKLLERQSVLEEGLSKLSEGQVRIEKRLNVVYEQTAMPTEFRTETNNKLTEISNTIDFLLHKGCLTEKEIFVLKKDISLVRK